MKLFLSLPYRIGFFCFTFLLSSVFAQVEMDKTWLDKMQDPEADFRQIQQQFQAYWQNRSDYKGNGYKVFKRWEYIQEMRVQANGKLRPADYVWNEYNRYMNEYEANNSMNKSASGTWSLVGPNSYPTNLTGQPTGMGRVNCVAFHPTDANTLYIGAPAGGIWKSTNHGTTWTNLSANIPHLGVSAILIHPTDPNILYIGTGDRDGGDAPGIGVFKSTDGGATWKQMNLGMGNVTVGMMLMHPSNPDILLAASNKGIFKTTNAAQSWTQTANASYVYKDIKFKPGDPSIVYAARTNNSPSEFYRSTDNGSSWTQITAGIPTSGVGSRSVLGVSAADPSVVYLLQITEPGSRFSALLKSTDSGLSFTTQSTSPNLMDYACDGSGTSSQATYDLCMAVLPTDANTVYVGGINTWKSTNGGVSWSINNHWVGSCSVPAVHADHHSLDFSPLNGNLYLGHDGGISYTANGSSWTEITNNLAISQIYRLGQSTHNVNHTIMGFQDNGVAFTTNGTSFSTRSGGDGMECLIDYDNGNFCYSTYVDGYIRRSTTGLAGSYSMVADMGFGGLTEKGAWVTPYFLHKSTPSIMFLGYKNVWRCNNIRATPASSVVWEALTTGETENCIQIEQSPVDNNIFYAVRNGSLKRSDNINAAANAVSWTVCTLPAGLTPSDIKASPVDANVVFATAGMKVFKSTDKGLSWTELTGNLPALYVNCLVLDKDANEGIYIGNETGVWYKDATVTDWQMFSSGLPPVDVRELEIYYDSNNPLNNRIKAATYGRGLWQSDLIQINTINPTNFALVPNGSTTMGLTWTKNAQNDNVLIAFAPTTMIGVPADGIAYNNGDPLPGGGTVAYAGSASSFTHTGLTSGATYCYKIWSVNGSNQYSAGLPIQCASTLSHVWTGAASTTDWFTPSNWGAGTVPTLTDGVYIPAGLGFYPVINAAGAQCKDLYIEPAASLGMSAATSYTLNVSGDWTNNGTFNRGIGAVSFNGTNALQQIKGTSTTAFHILNLNKGNRDNILEALSLITLNAAADPLTISAGTFKLSSASTITPFTTGTGANLNSFQGLWNNGGTINYGAIGWSLNAGYFRLSAGTVNMGTAVGNSITYLNNGTFIMEGGQMNVAGRFSPNSGTSFGQFTMSGGTLTLNTQGSTSTTRAPFEINPGVLFNMSGGTIVIRRTSSHPSTDVLINPNTYSLTGGTLQIGDALSPSAQNIRLQSSIALHNLNVNIANGSAILNTSLSLQNDLHHQAGTLNIGNNTLSLRGNWIADAAFAPSNGTVRFNGTSPQQISGSSTPNFYKLNIDNSTGLSQTNPAVKVTNSLDFVNGLYATNGNTFTMGDDATVTGASAAKYVDGKCRKEGNDTFTFPIGKNGLYAPLTISAPASPTDAFDAEYFNGYNPALDTAAMSNQLARVSGLEYWQLDRTNGTSAVKVGLTWESGRSTAMSALLDMRVARWNGSEWLSEGADAVSGNTNAGSVVSNPVSNFSHFALATIAPLLSATGVQTYCHGYDVNLQYNGTPVDSVGWTLTAPGKTYNLKGFSYIQDTLASGTYDVELKGYRNGSMFNRIYSGSFVILPPVALPTLVQPALNPVGVCRGSQINLQLAAASGFTNHWLWLTNSNVITTLTANDMIVTADANKTYYAYSEDDNTGCWSKTGLPVRVNVLAIPNASAGIDRLVCPGTNTAVGPNSVTGWTYSWSPVAMLSAANVSRPTLTNIPQGFNQDYVLTVTGTNGCVRKDTVNVSARDISNLIAATQAGADQVVCSGQPAQIGASPTSGYTYTWSPSASLSNRFAASPTHLFNSPSSTSATQTNYVVTVRENSSACTRTDTVRVTTNPLPAANRVNAGADATLVQGASATIGGVNAVAGLTYTWSPTTGLAAPYSAKTTASPSLTTLYTLSVANSFGCARTDEVLLTVVSVKLARETDLFVAYPNPFEGEILLKTNEALSGEVAWQLASEVGQLLQEGKENVSGNILDLQIRAQDYPKGVYLLRIVYAGQTYNFKLVKE